MGYAAVNVNRNWAGKSSLKLSASAGAEEVIRSLERRGNSVEQAPNAADEKREKSRTKKWERDQSLPCPKGPGIRAD